MTDTVLRVGGPSARPEAVGGYDVIVGVDLAGRLAAMLGPGVQRVAVICGKRVDPFLDHLLEALGDLEVTPIVIPDGEAAKTVEVVSSTWEVLGDEGFTRSDAIVTLGGGSTTDVGGFVAATWLRGVRVVHLPTTLLGMVDAAVGGKTGINTGSGKNLVGAFHEPAGVLCDLRYLETLPREEIASGLGEVVKCGFIADPEILRLIEETEPGTLTAGSPVLRELVERAIRVKIDVVVADLLETGGTNGAPGREVLNYGHTLAHAIERVEDYGIRHGEAVAIGCVYVAELARLAGRLDPAVADRHTTVFARLGLPTSYDRASFEDLLKAMKVDKKARGSQLRFVVLSGLAVPEVLTGPDEADLRAAYAALGGSTS